jgi:iron complex outermembrane receptor protein
MVIAVAAFLLWPACDTAYCQQAEEPQQLQAVEIEPPAGAQREISARTGQASGFGTDRSEPSGMPFSDFPLTPGEVISTSKRTESLVTVHSAVSVIDNRGVGSLGKGGLSDMLRGQVGLWTSGFAGNPFDAPIVIRGFSNESVNRVSLIVDGTNLNIPRQEINTNFIFPELIERIEVLRGDGNIQFGDKAIGGAISIITKKPRQHPGVMYGAEAGSWHTDREWLSVNFVRDSWAAGLFIGRYSQEGWRIHYDQKDGWDDPVTRPGPWGLINVRASFNWKILSNLTLDVTHLKSDQRLGNYHTIAKERWDRRDTRDVSYDVNGNRVFDDFPEERWDNLTALTLLYEGGLFGDIEVKATRRCYDRSIRNFFSFTIGSDQRWKDYGLSFKYTRTDNYAFIHNALTLGNEHANGRFNRETRNFSNQVTLWYLDPGYNQISGTAPSTNFRWPPNINMAGAWAQLTGLGHSSRQRGDLQTLSYYIINQTTLWDRIVIGLGYRIENYDLKNLMSEIPGRPTVRCRITKDKSASQWSLGFIYDTELGSTFYYKHSRMYRFPNFDDMINLTFGFGFSHPDPIWFLEPEEGTLEEWGIRHWFTPNMYVGATYYELDMDSEIYFGRDPDPAITQSRNQNVPNVSHWGLELEGMFRLTPRWTVRGNYTNQHAVFNANWTPFDALNRSTEGKSLTLNPLEMANVSLSYDNREWGFSGMISYNYIGSRYMINDTYAEWAELEPVKTGNFTISQTVLEGLATVYMGVNNFSDRQTAVQGAIATVYPPPTFTPTSLPTWWPDAGRTYFLGIKGETDFHRMKLPTMRDLDRMRERLYGALNDGVGTFTGMGSWMRNLASFR